MISAPTHDPDVAAVLAITGVGYIEKPIDAWQLLGLLSDAARFPAVTDPDDSR